MVEYYSTNEYCIIIVVLSITDDWVYWQSVRAMRTGITAGDYLSQNLTPSRPSENSTAHCPSCRTVVVVVAAAVAVCHAVAAVVVVAAVVAVVGRWCTWAVSVTGNEVPGPCRSVGRAGRRGADWSGWCRH